MMHGQKNIKWNKSTISRYGSSASLQGCWYFLSPTRKETSYSDRRFWFSYTLFIIIIGAPLYLLYLSGARNQDCSDFELSPGFRWTAFDLLGRYSALVPIRCPKTSVTLPTYGAWRPRLSKASTQICIASFICVLSSEILGLTSCPWYVNLFVCFWHNSPHWAKDFSFTRFIDHTQRRTTVGSIPLDEWSARRRDLYLTTHNTHNRYTSMPPVGFEPTISAGVRP
jgi:hypothetical protein